MATLLNLEQNKAPVDMHRKTDIVNVGSAATLFAHAADVAPLFNETPGSSLRTDRGTVGTNTSTKCLTNSHIHELTTIKIET